MSDMTSPLADVATKWEAYKAAADSPTRHDPFLLEPFPTPLDVALDALVTAFDTMPASDRRQWSADVPVTQRDSQILLTYAARMATQALREASTERIGQGLIAHLIEGERDDWRENIIVLTLLFDAAKKVGADPNTLFAAAASLEPGKPASDTLVNFRHRKPEAVTIEAMGYRTAMTPQGVRYEPDPAIWRR